jgi:hypothetical protein
MQQIERLEEPTDFQPPQPRKLKRAQPSQPLPEEIIKTLMTDTYYRALEHRGLPITGKVAKEALKLARVSMDCAKTLINGGPSLSEEDANSLKVQFEQVRKNRTIADLGDTEILH